MNEELETLHGSDRKPKVGEILFDKYYSDGRKVKLIARVNPPGATPPYWQVENTVTGKKSLIRENRLFQKRRWSYANVAQD